MMIRFLPNVLCVVLLSIVLVGATNAQKQPSTPRDPLKNPFASPIDDPNLPRVLIIGDSISIGYTTRVRKLLINQANVHRPATNCRWSAFGASKIKDWTGDSPWDVIHFNFGLWDWYGWSQETKATPESYAESLQQIVSELKTTNAELIFGMTTPPCVGLEKNAKLAITKERAEEFNQAAQKVMERNGVRVNDLYAVIDGQREKFQLDENDVHYNDKGRDVLAAKVAESVGSVLPKPKRPNIVFLFADDQRADTIGAHSNSNIRTPNLDQLAIEGFSFRRNYCAGSFSGAVCVASRAMLMTGRHWMSLPRENPQSNWGDATSLPMLLSQKAGYKSFIVGKWHNGKKTLSQSFANGRSVYMGGMANHADFQVQDLSNGELSAKRKASEFSSTEFANEAVRFIESQDGDEPYFLYVAFMAPHDPRNPPEKYREMYYKNRPPLPANFLPEHPFQLGTQTGRDEGLARWPRTKEVVGDQLCEYYGLVTHLDEQIGRIVEAVDSSDKSQDTIVIYTADHGLAMGSHGLLGKQNIYEQSMSSPLILRGQGIPKGRSSNALTYVHDLYSTVCDFANVAVPEKKVDSKNLVPVMNGYRPRVRDSVFLPYKGGQRSVSDGRWKLHVYPRINHRMLFDLDSDPHEQNDLIENKDHRSQLANMEALMESWRIRLDDPYPLQVDEPDSKTPVYDNDKRVLDVWQPKWIRDKYFDGRSKTNHGKRK